MAICALLTNSVLGGPYNEPGIPGYIGPDGLHTDPEDPCAVVNPIFRGWATQVVSYEPAPDVGYDWDDPTKALGPATGDFADIVSLGELSDSQIAGGVLPGRITLSFGTTISDGPGCEFAVFENGFMASQMFAELAYAEVSSDGVHFARLPPVSLTPGLVGDYGTISTSNVFNLAGKHPNANGVCTATLFDLDDLREEPNVISGLVDLNNITYIRIVDIPGSGDFFDRATRHIDPNTWPNWDYYDGSHPIYDAWETWDSGGFDLEAVGVLHPQQCAGDINLDGIIDGDDLVQFASSWLTHFGQPRWNSRCDVAGPKNLVIDFADFAILAGKWLKSEQWRGP